MDNLFHSPKNTFQRTKDLNGASSSKKSLVLNAKAILNDSNSAKLRRLIHTFQRDPSLQWYPPKCQNSTKIAPQHLDHVPREINTQPPRLAKIWLNRKRMKKNLSPHTPADADHPRNIPESSRHTQFRRTGAPHAWVLSSGIHAPFNKFLAPASTKDDLSGRRLTFRESTDWPMSSMMSSLGWWGWSIDD